MRPYYYLIVFNMKNILIAYLLLIFLEPKLIAQNKMLTMDDAIIKSKISLAPKRLPQLMWVKGINDFSYIDTSNSKEVLLRGNPEGKVNAEYTNLTTLNAELKKAKIDTLKHFPTITWKDMDHFSFEWKKKSLTFDGKTKKLQIDSAKDLGDDAENQDVEKNTGNIAFTKENNLFVFKDNESIQITNDPDKNIVNGKSVHREEFGIFKGTFWSPKGTALAFYRMDQTMVADYPVIDWSQKPAKANIIKYPMAGGTSHHVTLGVYNLATKTTVFLKTGEPADQYLTNIAWSPDEQHIYIAVLNRDQNHLKFNSYNAKSGDYEQTLFEEHNDKYVQPMHPMIFVPNQNDLFLWQSCRDGYNHLYLYYTNGSLKAQLTKGPYEVTNVLGFDPKGEKLFFTSNERSPVNRQCYVLELKSGIKTQLTHGEGTHTATFNDNFDFFIDNFTSLEIPRNISIINAKGLVTKNLLYAENPLKDYQLGRVSIFTIPNNKGDLLYCRMFLPINFDSTKKYPVIDYMYGGPNVQLVNNTFPTGNELWFQYMAQHGFVVFNLDNRGSANRGKDFEQATFRNLGTQEMEDQIKGVEYLKSLPFVNPDRIGIHGWSFGGFMTVSMMTRHPGIFKCAVAGGPVIDWSFYEVMYTERYMDTPLQNPDGYDKSNLLNYVDKLQGKMMLIHGTADDVVVWQHSLMYLKAAVDKGIQLDYFTYPGHQHNVLGKDRVHLMNKITDYFLQNL